jgi:formate hydrogenlyase subunit 6/NADH:ubiquinone oxidoreductase subunit I/menaquinone-dependent protoporphyrinogen IX oxidase
MRIAIIYHTGTGSTARCAEEIGKGWRNLGHEVHYFRIKANSTELLDGFDLVGIGVPTMNFRLSSFVKHHLQTYPKSSQPYFIFNTCAGSPGNTIYNISQILSKKGWRLIGSLSIAGKGSINIIAWRPTIEKSTLEKDGFSDEVLVKAQDFPKTLIENYQKIIVNQTLATLKEKFHLFLAPMMLMPDSLLAKGTIGKKRVILEKCTKCGLCATVICPSGCISMDDKNLPKFNEKLCIGCQGCVNLCPSLAIEGKAKGKSPFTLFSIWVLKPLQ